MQFRPAEVKDPAFKVARIIRNDGFIETADLLACGILHLGAVSTVLEYKPWVRKDKGTTCHACRLPGR